MKFLVFVAMIFLSSNASAETERTLSKDATEAITAVANCPTQLKKLTDLRVNFEETSALTIVSSPLVSETAYYVKTTTGGYAPTFRKERGPLLVVLMTVTQPPMRIPDKPASVKWNCYLIPPFRL